MTPYYSQSGIDIYHGDCRDVIEQWEGLRTQSFDLLLTDPPYGLRWGSGRSGWGWFKAVTSAETWTDVSVDELLPLVRATATHHIIFGGNYYDLPPARCWLVWDKQNGATDFADCELAWTNLDKAVRLLSHSFGNARRLHPSEKPEPVMRWALMQAPENVKTVLDPFMGSGTTLVACKRLGRTCVGIEREEKYCEIAARRLSQEALPLETPA